MFPHRPMYILTFDFTIVGVRHTAEFTLGTVQAVNASNIPLFPCSDKFLLTSKLFAVGFPFP